MRVQRHELEDILGMRLPPLGTFKANYVSTDGVRRAFIGLDADGRLEAEVTDHDMSDPESILSFVAEYDPEEGGYLLVGDDGSGEGSDAQDPRCALSSFRRITRVMVPVD